MDAVPRISRAQSMDALSSQANVAGYKAVLVAANSLAKFLPMMTTAAGTIRPAKVLVLGAGVAGIAGDRDGASARRGRLGIRRAARRQGTGRKSRREVPRIRSRREGRAGQGRLREGTFRGSQTQAAADARREDQGVRRGHHHRVDSRRNPRRASSQRKPWPA